MRTDVHLAALKAAAKVAFSVVLLNGCSSGAKVASPEGSEGTNESNIADGSGSASGSKGETKGEETAAKDKDKDTEKQAKDAGTQPPKTCDETLAATFPTPGEYQWEPIAQSSDVVACCDTELTEKEFSTPYRWECCVAFDPKVSDGGLGETLSSKHSMACTPWGPPVPPAMTRTRRGNPDVAAWIEAAGRAVA